MDKENFKSILAMPEINASGIAAKMFEGKANPRARLNSKVNELKGGNGKQRLTDEDLQKGEKVLRELAETILKKL